MHVQKASKIQFLLVELFLFLRHPQPRHQNRKKMIGIAPDLPAAGEIFHFLYWYRTASVDFQWIFTPKSAPPWLLQSDLWIAGASLDVRPGGLISTVLAGASRDAIGRRYRWIRAQRRGISRRFSSATPGPRQQFSKICIGLDI